MMAVIAMMAVGRECEELRSEMKALCWLCNGVWFAYVIVTEGCQAGSDVIRLVF